MQKMFFLFYLLFSTLFLHANNFHHLLEELDNSIQERSEAFSKKEKKILQLKEQLSTANSDKQQFSALDNIIYEYSYYKIDSAVCYVNKAITMANALQDKDRYIEFKIKKAHYLCFLRLFYESLTILDNINYNELSLNQQKQYLNTIIHIYHNKTRALKNSYSNEVNKAKMLNYCDQYFEIEKEETYEALSLLAYKYFLEENYINAEIVVNKILQKELSVYQRTETLYNLAGIYYELGDFESSQKILIEEAILCNRYAITKNPPLMQLALLLANDNYARSYKYIDIAINDASIFSIDHKVTIREKTYNVIQNAYYHKIERQKSMLQIVICIIFFLTLIVLFVLFKLYYTNKNLKKIRKELMLSNNKLKDSTKIKEFYVIYFLNQYSNYIDKITEYKKYIIRLAKSGYSADMVRSDVVFSINIKEHLNNFFEDFDTSVLELFPSFVQEINLLLKPDRIYEVTDPQKGSSRRLNTELRLLALLRLGIDENKDIARFFRFTIQTVYNYRSKARARAIDENTFEERVKNICNY